MSRGAFKDSPYRPEVPVYDGEGPWPQGHTLSLLHGIYSDRVRAPVEERLAEVLRRSMAEGLGTVYNEALDEHAVRRAARALATVEMVEAWIDQHGVEAVSNRLAETYRTAGNQSTKWLQQLGMTPAARAKLGVDVAKQYDLVAALEDRREQRERSPNRRQCSFCGEARGRYRVKGTRQIVCRSCASQGAYR